MSSDKTNTKGTVDDHLKAYERKLPAESAVTTEHTVSYVHVISSRLMLVGSFSTDSWLS